MSFINTITLSVFKNDGGDVSIVMNEGSSNEQLISIPLGALKELGEDLIYLHETLCGDENEVV